MLKKPTREILFFCSRDKREFKIPVPFGCFIHVQNGASVEMLEERPGRTDRLVEDIVCPKCGTAGGLTMVEEPKTK